MSGRTYKERQGKTQASDSSTNVKHERGEYANSYTIKCI
jgi:hypothetical protein